MSQTSLCLSRSKYQPFSIQKIERSAQLNRVSLMDWTDSIGGFKYGRKGGYTFWEANGIAREIYDTTLYQATSEAIASVREQICGVRLTLCMVGKTKKEALPTIVIAGGTKKERKIVLNSIKEIPEMEENEFQTASLPCFPPTGSWRARAKLGDVLENSTGPEVYYNPGSRLIGLPIQIKAANHVQPIKATGGGIIQCGDKFFYLTTAHAFQRELVSLYESDPEDSEDEFEIHGQVIRIGLDDSTTDSEGRGSETPSDSGSDQTSVSERSSSDNSRDSTCELDGASVEAAPDMQSTLELLGHKVFDSTQGSKPGLDYALIEVTVPGFRADNAIDINADPDTSFGPTTVISAGPYDVDVIIVTGSEKPLRGTMSGTRSLIASGHEGVNRMHELWTVRVQEELRDGDCGSWVLHANTGALFGHIVADNSAHGLAYVVPALHVLEDLRREFDTTFLLPVPTSKPPLNNPISGRSRQSLDVRFGSAWSPHQELEGGKAERLSSTFTDGGKARDNSGLEAGESPPSIQSQTDTSDSECLDAEETCQRHSDAEGSLPYTTAYRYSYDYFGPGTGMLNALANGMPRARLRKPLIEEKALRGNSVPEIAINTESLEFKPTSTSHTAHKGLRNNSYTGPDKPDLLKHNPMTHFSAVSRKSIAAMDDKGRAALMRAAAAGQATIVRLLLELGADHEQSALIVAAEHGHDEVIHLLICHGLDPSAADDTGNAALLCASRNGHIDAVLLLLLNGVDISAADKSGRTPLTEAVRNGHTEVVRLLVDSGCDITAQDYRGRTPPVETACRARPRVAQKPIHARTSVSAGANTRRTPLEDAGKGGHASMTDLIVGEKKSGFGKEPSLHPGTIQELRQRKESKLREFIEYMYLNSRSRTSKDTV